MWGSKVKLVFATVYYALNGAALLMVLLLLAAALLARGVYLAWDRLELHVAYNGSERDRQADRWRN